MQENLSNYCQSKAQADREALKISWKAAMATFQRLDVFTWGPLAASNKSLRYEMYSWPQTEPCWVDREVVNSASAEYQLPSHYNRKGLDALEYLIFDKDLNHACTAAVPQTKGWNELPESDKIANRCRYQALLVDDVIASNSQAIDEWKKADGSLIQPD